MVAVAVVARAPQITSDVYYEARNRVRKSMTRCASERYVPGAYGLRPVKVSSVAKATPRLEGRGEDGPRCRGAVARGAAA